MVNCGMPPVLFFLFLMFSYILDRRVDLECVSSRKAPAMQVPMRLAVRLCTRLGLYEMKDNISQGCYYYNNIPYGLGRPGISKPVIHPSTSRRFIG